MKIHIDFPFGGSIHIERKKMYDDTKIGAIVISGFLILLVSLVFALT